MQRHRLQVAAERLAYGDRPSQPACFPQRGAGPGEPGGQRPAIGHHVDHADGARFSCFVEASQYRCQRGVQVGHHHRHPGDVGRVAQRLVVRRALLVGAEHDRLQRGVPGLDQVPGPGTVRRQAVRHRGHQRVPAGTQPQVERGRVEQHAVTGPGPPGQRRVGQRAYQFRALFRGSFRALFRGSFRALFRGRAGHLPVRRASYRTDRHLQLHRPGPFPAHPHDRAVPPRDHFGRVAAQAGRQKPAREACRRAAETCAGNRRPHPPR